MNQSESVSDSDSSTSSSWIFIDDCEGQNEIEKNKYYLNCSSEPVQELTNHCLPAVNSEPETDSDGISIISESEDIKENAEEPVVIDESNNIPIEDIRYDHPDVKDDFYFNKYIVALWVVIAVTTPLLLNYFFTYKDKDSVFQDIVDSRDTSSKFYNRKFSNLEENVLPHYCDQHDANKRYDSKGEVDLHRLHCKNVEHLCVSKEEGKKKKGEFKDVRYDFKKKLSKQKDISKPEETDLTKSIDKDDAQRSALFTDKQRNKKQKNKNEKNIAEYEMKQKQKKNKKKNHKKDDIDDSGKKKKKNKKVKEGNDEYHEVIEKLSKLVKNKDREIKELTKILKTKDKQLKMLEYKILKQLNLLRKSEMKGKQFEIERNDKKNNSSDNWYFKLNKGRKEARQQNLELFLAQRRRIRNNWYWNWMTAREQLRVRKPFWQFTY